MRSLGVLKPPSLARCLALGLVAVLALGLALRAYRISYPFVFSDEAFSWRVADCPLPDLLRRAAGDTHPPLHYLLLHGWMAAWGDSPAALRGLSVLCGVLAIGASYLVVVEACAGPRAATWQERGGGLLAAALMAVHWGQILPARTARMYSLGVLLALVSAWLLLRALRAVRFAPAWWTLYGVAVAAFCYAHNFAFFTVAGQTAFVLADVARQWFASRELSSPEDAAARERATRSACGFLRAGLVAFALYSPWLPVFQAQLKRVQQSFWVDAPTLRYLTQVLLAWLTGLEVDQSYNLWQWGSLAAVVAWWVFWRIDRARWFFLAQAAGPWALMLLFWWATGRSLVLDRYLVFAQAALFCLLGATWARLPGGVEQAILAAVLLVPAALASGRELAALPATPPVLEVALEFLQSEHHAGDLLVVDRPSAVNCVRYYARRTGMPPIDVRVPALPQATSAHVNHISSLSTDDLVHWEWSSPPAEFERIWFGLDGSGRLDLLPEQWKLTVERTYPGTEFGASYWLGRFERQGASE